MQLAGERGLAKLADDESGDIVERGRDHSTVRASWCAFERLTERDERDNFVTAEVDREVDAHRVRLTRDRAVLEAGARPRRKSFAGGRFAHQRHAVTPQHGAESGGQRLDIGRECRERRFVGFVRDVGMVEIAQRIGRRDAGILVRHEGAA